MSDAPQNDDAVKDDTVPDDQGAQSVEPADSDPAGADALGDAGKRALDAMKAKWREERDRRKALEEQMAQKPAGDAKPDDADAIRAEAAREATAKANARILRSEIKAAAAGKLADPADAIAFLDLTKFDVSENGEVDSDEISDAIEDLLTRKPHLAAKAAPRFQGTGDGGAARKASGPSQLTQEDLNGMSAEAIVKAKREGRLQNLLSGK